MALSSLAGCSGQRYSGSSGNGQPRSVHREDPQFRVGHAQLPEHPLEVRIADKGLEHRLVVPDIVIARGTWDVEG